MRDNKLLTEKELKALDNGGASARYIPLRMEMQHPDDPNKTCVLVSKIIYPVFQCLHCGSDDTYNRRIQSSGLLSESIDNVWRKEGESSDTTRLFKKYDFCFACGQEFLLEAFIHKVVDRKVRWRKDIKRWQKKRGLK